MKKPPESELRKTILQKLSIIKNATESASHKVNKEKLEVAAEWLKEIHEQTKKLTKYCEEELK